MHEVIRSPRALGSVLREARRKVGLTQAELGNQAKLRQATISDLENGSGATLDTLFAVITALKLELTISDRRVSTLALDDIF